MPEDKKTKPEDTTFKNAQAAKLMNENYQLKQTISMMAKKRKNTKQSPAPKQLKGLQGLGEKPKLPTS